MDAGQALNTKEVLPVSQGAVNSVPLSFMPVLLYSSTTSLFGYLCFSQHRVLFIKVLI